MRLPLFAAALLLAIGADASGQTYKWIDKEGRVHYTQTPPPPGAKGAPMRDFRSAPTQAADLPYATRLASTNFPVKLYTWPDCGGPCDKARALMVRRAVPFREVSVVTQKEADELQALSGKNEVPTLAVGTQVHVGFQESAYNGMLDAAGYPSSAPPLPIEALRRVGSADKAQQRRGEGAGGTPDSEAAGR